MPAEQRRTVDAPRRRPERPIGDKGGFELVLRDRYLLWIALLVLVLSVVNANGRGGALSPQEPGIFHIPRPLRQRSAAEARQPRSRTERDARLAAVDSGDFYAGFQLTVNISHRGGAALPGLADHPVVRGSNCSHSSCP